ncbi:MAG: beta-lactamase family protein [Alphaproteobacteria bacterium]|nr:beta-lactamase family protein [Alphaproteobacteria bacterium]
MLKRWLAIFFLLCAIPALAKQPALPDTPAGRAFGAYLAAFNSQDVEKIRAFGKAFHWDVPPEGPAQWSRVISGMRLLRVLDSRPDELTALVEQGASEQVMKATVKTGGKYLFVGFDLADRPADLAIPRLSQQQAVAALAQRAQGLAAQDKMSGVLLIARHGQIIFERAWGLADRRGKTPNTLETKFRIASLDKMFTAVAILQLTEQGKVSLQGKVGDYLPDYPNKKIATEVTIRELLNHTGGTGEAFTAQYMAHRTQVRTLADYVTLFGTRGPDFAPGSKDDYSNYGYVLLGRIVERVSGISYYDYVQRHIFDPTGMKDTGALPETTPVPGRAAGYTWRNGRWSDSADTLPWRGTSAGGGYSTAPDLLRFALALQAGKLIPSGLLAQATLPQNNGHWYGYGFETHGAGATRYFSHSGGAYGSNAEFRVYPKLGVVAIGLCNLDPNVCTDLIEWYANRMPAAP